MATSNDKYLVENLRHLLKEANDESNNMKLLIEFQLSELEDKSQKVSFSYNAIKQWFGYYYAFWTINDLLFFFLLPSYNE